MEITEVRVKLITAKNEKLRAFCSITIDNDFVIRDLKVIEGAKGPFVAMPSRKVMVRCRGCGEKNHHRANFCNECGGRLSPSRNGRGFKLHADIAHPINAGCREMVQNRVLEHYSDELEKSRQPGYRPADIDDYGVDTLEEEGVYEERTAAGDAAAGVGDAAREIPEPARDGSFARPGRGAGARFGRPREFQEVPRARGAASDRPAAEERDSDSRFADRRRPRSEEPEPEDNFGAGLFS